MSKSAHDIESARQLYVASIDTPNQKAMYEHLRRVVEDVKQREFAKRACR